MIYKDLPRHIFAHEGFCLWLCLAGFRYESCDALPREDDTDIIAQNTGVVLTATFISMILDTSRIAQSLAYSLHTIYDQMHARSTDLEMTL